MAAGRDRIADGDTAASRAVRLPLEWPRSVSAPPALIGLERSVRCLWAGGFLCHRSEVCRQLGLVADVALPQVVEAAYERWGEAFVDRIEGSVSAVLWSCRDGALLMVADRTGHGAPSWGVVRGDLWIGSNPAEILSALPERPPVDRDSLVCHVGAQAPPVGRTFFSGVHLVPAGHRLWLTPRHQRLERYWDPADDGGPESRSDVDGDVEGTPVLLNLLRKVVASYATERMGVTLTSGLDSNSLAAAAATSSTAAPVTGFTWAFSGTPSADEVEEARLVARRLGLAVREVEAEGHWPLSREGPLTPLESPFRLHYEELWEATFYSVRAAGLRVLCTGTGGDSLFGGATTTYADLLLCGRWLELVRQLGEHLPHSRIGLRQVVRRMVLWPLAVAYLPPLRARNAPPVPWLTEPYRGRFTELVNGGGPAVRLQLPSRYLRLRELSNRTLPWVLRRLQLLAHRHDVRLVHPYLDRRLVEGVLRLPPNEVFTAGVWKIGLRQAMRGLLPDGVVERREKIVPLAFFERGLREKERVRLAELTTGMRCAEMGLVDEAALHRHCHDYVEGRHADSRFWYTLTLEDWLRNHF